MSKGLILCCKALKVEFEVQWTKLDICDMKRWPKYPPLTHCSIHLVGVGISTTGGLEAQIAFADILIESSLRTIKLKHKTPSVFV